MAMILAVLILTAATVARARHRGIPWIDIAAYPSQWFNWTFVGGEFDETFSASVGYKVREGAPPSRGWVAVCFLIDMLFLVRERHHCEKSLYRRGTGSREDS